MQCNHLLALFLFLFFPFGKNKDGSLPLCIIVIIDIVYDDGLVFMSASYFLWPCNYLERKKNLFTTVVHIYEGKKNKQLLNHEGQKFSIN